MVEDRQRTSAYLAAIRATLRPGDHVLELGTGFGYFAVHAALAGAAHVWAVEPNDAIALGPALAARHGVADRITFLQRRGDQVELPRRADVLLEDLRGVSPLMGRRAAALADAHARLLAPDARLIALRDHLMVAPCMAPEGARERPIDTPADTLAAPPSELDLSAVRARATAAWRRVRASALHPLADAGCWATWELRQALPTDLRGSTECVVRNAGEMAGIGAWFDADLAGGARISSGPTSPATVYDAAWFPLAQPVSVQPGDRVTIRMRATHDGGEYVWSWEVECRPQSGAASAVQRGTDLGTRLLSPERRARRAATAVPTRDTAVDLHAAILARVDGRRSLAEIAAALRRDAPTRFAEERDALAFVSREIARIAEGAEG